MIMNFEELFNAVHNEIDFKRPVLFFVQLNGLLDSAYDFEVCMRLLPLSIQQKILNRKLSKDRQLKLLNQLILPFVQNLYSRTKDFTVPDFKFNEFGKPYLDNIGFNISDEDNMVSMIVDFENGIELGCDLANLKDVERFNEQGKFLDDFRDIFTVEEFEYLEAVKDKKVQNLALTQYWALKESYSKFLGIGLNESFAEFNFKNQVVPTRYYEPDLLEIYDGLTRLDDVRWKSYPLTDSETNYTVSLNSNIVCSVFSSRPIQLPVVVEIHLELLINFIKCSL